MLYMTTVLAKYADITFPVTLYVILCVCIVDMLSNQHYIMNFERPSMLLCKR